MSKVYYEWQIPNLSWWPLKYLKYLLSCNDRSRKDSGLNEIFYNEYTKFTVIPSSLKMKARILPSQPFFEEYMTVVGCDVKQTRSTPYFLLLIVFKHLTPNMLMHTCRSVTETEEWQNISKNEITWLLSSLFTP